LQYTLRFGRFYARYDLDVRGWGGSAWVEFGLSLWGGWWLNKG